MEWTIVNVTDPGVNHQALVLNCTTAYVFEVIAWNEQGGSPSPLKAWPIKTGRGQTLAQRDLGDTSDSGIVLLSLVKGAYEVHWSTIKMAFLITMILKFEPEYSQRGAADLTMRHRKQEPVL